jgi:lysozyme family protein
VIDQDGIYGAATAAAVLAYKKKRNIINHSYQAQADNIVGKMTVAALDKEMVEREQAPIAVQTIKCQLATVDLSRRT